MRRLDTASDGQNVARQPLRLGLALSDDAVAVRQLYGYVVAFQDVGTSKFVGRFAPRRCHRAGRVSASVCPDREQSDREPVGISGFVERWDSGSRHCPWVAIDDKPLIER